MQALNEFVLYASRCEKDHFSKVFIFYGNMCFDGITTQLQLSSSDQIHSVIQRALEADSLTTESLEALTWALASLTDCTDLADRKFISKSLSRDIQKTFQNYLFEICFKLSQQRAAEEKTEQVWANLVDLLTNLFKIGHSTLNLKLYNRLLNEENLIQAVLCFLSDGSTHQTSALEFLASCHLMDPAFAQRFLPQLAKVYTSSLETSVQQLNLCLKIYLHLSSSSDHLDRASILLLIQSHDHIIQEAEPSSVYSWLRCIHNLLSRDCVHASFAMTLAQQLLFRFEKFNSKIVSQIVFETIRILETIAD